MVWKRINYKLHSKSGESIAEVLIAALIIAFALILLESMLMASRRLVTNSEKTFTRNMEAKDIIESDSGTIEANLTVYMTGQIMDSETESQDSDPTDFTFGSNNNTTQKMIEKIVVKKVGAEVEGTAIPEQRYTK